MYSDEDLLPVSALQHLVFCERQCALIHVEQAWSENRLTAEGRILHERVHERGQESRGNVRKEFGVPLRSLRLGLVGVADVVEFHRAGTNDVWKPFPIEYKRGKPKADRCDEVQLCAQAMCLEEMLEREIAAGAIFYGRIRRRHDVTFADQLRKETEQMAFRLHELIRSRRTPPAQYAPRCKRCSLYSVCMPKLGKKSSVAEYMAQVVE